MLHINVLLPPFKPNPFWEANAVDKMDFDCSDRWNKTVEWEANAWFAAGKNTNGCANHIQYCRRLRHRTSFIVPIVHWISSLWSNISHLATAYHIFFSCLSVQDRDPPYESPCLCGIASNMERPYPVVRLQHVQYSTSKHHLSPRYPNDEPMTPSMIVQAQSCAFSYFGDEHLAYKVRCLNIALTQQRS
jgi:hypothetical protein